MGLSGRHFKKVAILMGGMSAEREVSLSTGKNCAQGLRAQGFDVTEIDAKDDVYQRLIQAAPDVVFNALHGRWGEDGCIQGMLEWMKLPYTHSGIIASATAMDKEMSKHLYRQVGLPVAHSVLIPKAAAMASHAMPPPYVIKPHNEGSSIGIHFVNDPHSPPPVLGDDMPDSVMVETFCPGRDLTVTILGDRALGVTDIITSDWHNYEAKYTKGVAQHVVPAQIPDEITRLCEHYAMTAHNALGCRSISRTDFLWDDQKGADGVIILETNTQPGMTPTSLAPEQAAVKGMSVGELCQFLVEEASCDR